MEETIAAVATPMGEGGIGVIRVSGAEAERILLRVFRPAQRLAPRRFSYGRVIDPESGETVDEAMAVFLPAPWTYTREDVAEIQCHGSAVALGKTLELVLRSGARLAEPGEFTKRAFLNGRLDLSQAESVMDLISARTERGYSMALGQLEGKLSGEVRALRERLLELLAHLAVSLDFPEEDVEELSRAKTAEILQSVRAELSGLLATADTGRILREGLKVAIVGRPNVGKSSLLNALLREKRAIVTEIPGTTRDTIEESLDLGGIPLLLTDTAGIRQTEDRIERLGIEKSREAAEDADLVFFLIDAAEPLREEDRAIAEAVRGKRCFLLLNKSDLPQAVAEEEAAALLPGAELLRISAEKKEGLQALEERIRALVYAGALQSGSRPLVNNARHKALLAAAAEELDAALALLSAGEALDLLEMNVRAAWERLGEITGETAAEEIIEEVFRRFCLGK